MPDSVTIDGSTGEGGGQILRTSLALSVITGRPFELVNIRANRPKPGLRPQHVACVLAAATVGKAAVEGAVADSRHLKFWPTFIKPGDHAFDIGTAGSTTLVLQTVLPPLLYHGLPSTVTITGGTHNPLAPSVDFLQRTFLPVVQRAGAGVELSVQRRGFYPRGGGRIVAEVTPGPAWKPLSLPRRGELLGIRADAIVSGLAATIAERELNTLRRLFPGPWRMMQTIEEMNPAGPGNALVLHLESECALETVTVVGERGVSAEDVARAAAHEANAYLRTNAPVGAHLADQLMLPLLLAGGSYTTGPLSEHATTNIHTIAQFCGEGRIGSVAENGCTRIFCENPLRPEA